MSSSKPNILDEKHLLNTKLFQNNMDEKFNCCENNESTDDLLSSDEIGRGMDDEGWNFVTKNSEPYELLSSGTSDAASFSDNLNQSSDFGNLIVMGNSDEAIDKGSNSKIDTFETISVANKKSQQLSEDSVSTLQGSNFDVSGLQNSLQHDEKIGMGNFATKKPEQIPKSFFLFAKETILINKFWIFITICSIFSSLFVFNRLYWQIRIYFMLVDKNNIPNEYHLLHKEVCNAYYNKQITSMKNCFISDGFHKCINTFFVSLKEKENFCEWDISSWNNYKQVYQQLPIGSKISKFCYNLRTKIPKMIETECQVAWVQLVKYTRIVNVHLITLMHKLKFNENLFFNYADYETAKLLTFKKIIAAANASHLVFDEHVKPYASKSFLNFLHFFQALHFNYQFVQLSEKIKLSVSGFQLAIQQLTDKYNCLSNSTSFDFLTDKVQFLRVLFKNTSDKLWQFSRSAGWI